MGGSSLAELYGPSDLMRFIWTVVVGVGALVVGQSRFVSEFPPSTADAVPLPPRGTAFGFCTCFAVSNLASPFGWEVGPLGLGGGELACGVVWPLEFDAVYLDGSRWAW